MTITMAVAVSEARAVASPIAAAIIIGRRVIAVIGVGRRRIISPRRRRRIAISFLGRRWAVIGRRRGILRLRLILRHAHIGRLGSGQRRQRAERHYADRRYAEDPDGGGP